jgi:Fe-Mn family superoxide dismutase
MADHGAAMTTARAEGGTARYALPPLPYGYRALTPLLSEEALAVHHGKHHARYVDSLNRLLGESDGPATSLEEVVRTAHATNARALFNNAAQAWNHSFFWESMGPQTFRPTGLLAGSITSDFGSFDALGQRFIAEGTGHFGSGWVWLVAAGEKLRLMSTHDAGTPIVEEGVTPLLACDVWEHAYYIDYRQDRANWLTLWWDRLANWHFAERQYGAALGHGQPWQFPASQG